MTNMIHILHLEDEPADAELVQAKLMGADYTFRITLARTREEFEVALGTEKPDIILADYRLPTYDGLSALKMVREQYPEIPFIFVSGAMGEEAAIHALTQGATDYVLKENLNHLETAVTRALEEAKNIRQRKQAQKDLQSSNDLLRTVIEAAPVAVIGLDLKGCVQSIWNPGAEKMLGWSAQEVMGKPIPMVTEDCREQFKQFQEQVHQGMPLVDMEMCGRRQDGSPIDFCVYASPLHDVDGIVTGYIAVLVDMTQRKRAEKALRESERQKDMILNATAEMVTYYDLDLRIIMANRAAAESIGKSPEEMVGLRCHDIWHQCEQPCIGCPLLEARDHKEPRQREMVKPDGRIWLVRGFPIIDENKQVIALVGFVQDVTESKEAEQEREKMQEQFLQAQKMESVGRLAGGVAHDFNNMLGVILGYAELAMDEVGQSEPIFNQLQIIRNTAERSANLTRQLLAFARKQTVIPRVLHLNETVESMLKLLRKLIGEDVRLVWQPGTELWPVKIDPSQIDQILANLCVNARDAITGVGVVTIQTQKVVFDKAYCRDHPGATPGDYVFLGVSDNGCGMEKEVLENIFDPFFTTKEMGKGTGLGLATIYGIVKQNHGFIDVSSEPGCGSTFMIYLPRHAEEGCQPDEQNAASPIVCGAETILLVEDESTVLNMVQTMLEGCGYTVLTALMPGEALRIAQEMNGRLDLLITDVVMPEMTGRDFADKMHDLYPHIKCLFMSGYTGDVIAPQGVLEEGVNYIQKPFSRQSLADKVRLVLDE